MVEVEYVAHSNVRRQGGEICVEGIGGVEITGWPRTEEQHKKGRAIIKMSYVS